jgi:hypothetical protein
MPGAPYKVTVAPGVVREGNADDAGRVEVRLRDVEVPDQCRLEWGREKGGAAGSFQYSADFYAKLEEISEDEGLKRRLHNLGYSSGATPADNIKAYQRDYDRPEGSTGSAGDIKQDLYAWHDQGTVQALGEAGTTHPLVDEGTALA